MKTKRECKTIKETYATSRILVELFQKYKNYDSALIEHYDSNTLFASREKEIEVTSNNESVSIIEYRESIIKKIINKIKSFFNKNN